MLSDFFWKKIYFDVQPIEDNNAYKFTHTSTQTRKF